MLGWTSLFPFPFPAISYMTIRFIPGEDFSCMSSSKSPQSWSLLGSSILIWDAYILSTEIVSLLETSLTCRWYPLFFTSTTSLNNLSSIVTPTVTHPILISFSLSFSFTPKLIPHNSIAFYQIFNSTLLIFTFMLLNINFTLTETFMEWFAEIDSPSHLNVFIHEQTHFMLILDTLIHSTVQRSLVYSYLPFLSVAIFCFCQ